MQYARAGLQRRADEVPESDSESDGRPAIVADEVDMILGFAGVGPDEEDTFAVHSTQAASYDDDEDEEWAVAEEAKLQAEKEAAEAEAALQVKATEVTETTAAEANTDDKEDSTMAVLTAEVIPDNMSIAHSDYWNCKLFHK